jgi:hypothetical protein
LELARKDKTNGSSQTYHDEAAISDPKQLKPDIKLLEAS